MNAPFPMEGSVRAKGDGDVFPIDTKDPKEARRYVGQVFHSLFPGSNWFWLDTVFRDVEHLFAGHHPEYGPIDVRYHDLEHTIQATVCLADLLAGCVQCGIEQAPDARLFELAITAALLHDTGYLKHRSDTDGTGAKYTFCHVLRSSAFAASYLPTLGADELEVGVVMSAINCTGSTEVGRLGSRRPIEHMIGCALATADYVSQMAASNYPEKLPFLFFEFRESDEFFHIAPQRRMFGSVDQLIARTPAFWEKHVLPRLESEFAGLFRYLAQPFPDGRNRYLEAIRANIARLRGATADMSPTEPS